MVISEGSATGFAHAGLSPGPSPGWGGAGLGGAEPNAQGPARAQAWFPGAGRPTSRAGPAGWARPGQARAGLSRVGPGAGLGGAGPDGPGPSPIKQDERHQI